MKTRSVVSLALLAGGIVMADYVAIYRAEMDRLLAGQPMEQIRNERDLTRAASRACWGWMLAQRLDDDRYRAEALRLYDLSLTAVDGRIRDFHVRRPMGLLTWRLARDGQLTGSRRELARQMAQREVAWFLDERRFEEAWFDCNIALADTLGVAALAKAFADDGELRVAAVQARLAAYGHRIMETGDLNENACNYASLGIVFFLELAQLQGWLGEIRSSAYFRSMFARHRDLISPVGSIPEFGDGYFKHRTPRLDYVYLLEMAARLYNDASFLAAARRIAPAAAAEVRYDQLFRGYFLMELSPFQPGPATVPPLSLVEARRVPGKPVVSVPDKLILRTGREPGAAMIMVDLYARGSHAHLHKRPSVGYYEVAGVPLFHNIGRRGTRSAICGNSFWLWPDITSFPGQPREGEWTTMSVPANYCFPGDKPGEYRIGRDLLLRNFHNREVKALHLDNLRLEGPAGTMLLDGFERPDSWHGNVSRQPGVELVSSPDCTQGKASQKVNWGVLGSGYRTRLLEEEARRHTTFNLRSYDTVKFDYTFEGKHPHCNLRSLLRPARWTNLGNRTLDCEVERAVAHQMGRDAWADLAFSSYNGPGNRLHRRLVLTQEGALLIVDRFTPGPNARGWAVGQLWQFYALAERGDDWFVSASDGPWPQPDGSTAACRMLVKYMTGPGWETGALQVKPATMHALKADGSKQTTFCTTYSKRTLTSDSPVTAALVVIPIKAGQDPAALAATIGFRKSARGEVTVETGPFSAEGRKGVTISDDPTTPPSVRR